MLQEYNGSTMGFDHGEQDTSSSYDTILEMAKRTIRARNDSQKPESAIKILEVGNRRQKPMGLSRLAKATVRSRAGRGLPTHGRENSPD
jgi:hypothetical protein